MSATANDGVAVAVRARLRPAAPVRAFLAARRARAVLSATIACGAATAWLGMYETSLPAMATEDSSVVPLWRMLALVAAVVPLVTMGGGLADLEQVSTRRLRRCQNLYLGIMGFGCAAVYLGVSATTLSPPVLMIMARSWLAWYGLSLLAGVALGWRLSWVLPVTAACVLWYWGQAEHAQYRWWEFSARPRDDLPSLLLSVTLLAAGIAAYWATPWRRRRLAFWRRGGDHAPRGGPARPGRPK